MAPPAGPRWFLGVNNLGEKSDIWGKQRLRKPGKVAFLWLKYEIWGKKWYLNAPPAGPRWFLEGNNSGEKIDICGKKRLKKLYIWLK